MQLSYYDKSSLKDNIPPTNTFHIYYQSYILAMNWCSECALLVVQRKVFNPKYGRNAESYRVVKLIRI